MEKTNDTIFANTNSVLDVTLQQKIKYLINTSGGQTNFVVDPLGEVRYDTVFE